MQLFATHNLVLSLWDNGIGSQWSQAQLPGRNIYTPFYDSKQEEIIDSSKQVTLKKSKVNKKFVDEFVNMSTRVLPALLHQA